PMETAAARLGNAVRMYEIEDRMPQWEHAATGRFKPTIRRPNRLAIGSERGIGARSELRSAPVQNRSRPESDHNRLRTDNPPTRGTNARAAAARGRWHRS